MMSKKIQSERKEKENQHIRFGLVWVNLSVNLEISANKIEV